MSKRAHLSFRRIVPFIAMSLIAFTACGDDDSSKDAGTAGKGGGDEAGKSGSSAGGKGGSGAAGGSAGASGASAGSGGASGATGTGSLVEGDQCKTTAECGTGMVCLNAIVGQTPVKICARHCTPETEQADCGDEICDSYTNRVADAHCINLEPAPFSICGVGETSACGGDRACLYFQNSTIGVCVDPCATDPSQDAGIDGLKAMCPSGQMCIAGVADSDAVGICGTEAKRDEVCGIEMGKFCTGADICVPDNTSDMNSVEHCREDCTESGKCTSGGTCTAVRDAFSYCKK